MNPVFKLDSMYYKLFSKIQNVNYTNLTGATTHAKSNAGAFSLNDPGKSTKSDIKSKNTDQKSDDVFDVNVIRLVIPYVDVVKATEDFEWGFQYFSVLKNDLLKEMTTFRGFEFDQISFLRPGTNNSVFRDLEDFAGVELRLYATIKTEETNEING